MRRVGTNSILRVHASSPRGSYAPSWIVSLRQTLTCGSTRRRTEGRYIQGRRAPPSKRLENSSLLNFKPAHSLSGAWTCAHHLRCIPTVLDVSAPLGRLCGAFATAWKPKWRRSGFCCNSGGRRCSQGSSRRGSSQMILASSPVSCASTSSFKSWLPLGSAFRVPAPSLPQHS